MINAVSLFAVPVVDHRIAEVVYMAAGLPYGGVHEYGGINAYNIVMHLCHAAPPVVADVSFQLGAKLAVIVHGAEAIIYL